MKNLAQSTDFKFAKCGYSMNEEGGERLYGYPASCAPQGCFSRVRSSKSLLSHLGDAGSPMITPVPSPLGLQWLPGEWP